MFSKIIRRGALGAVLAATAFMCVPASEAEARGPRRGGYSTYRSVAPYYSYGYSYGARPVQSYRPVTVYRPGYSGYYSGYRGPSYGAYGYSNRPSYGGYGYPSRPSYGGYGYPGRPSYGGTGISFGPSYGGGMGIYIGR